MIFKRLSNTNPLKIGSELRSTKSH